MGHAVRAATDVNPELTVSSIDCVGAYDHVFRSAMLSKIWEMPALRPLLPLVRSVYARPSSYVWTDDEGQRHVIRQMEGGEQGDPSMPALFSLAIHNALVEAKSEMRPDEQLCAFLDDIYALSSPDRTHDLYELLGVKLASAGNRLHTCKTRCWNRSGVPPPTWQNSGQTCGAHKA